MIQEYAGEAGPGRWQQAGRRAFSPCRDEVGPTARAAHPSQLEGMIGTRWLTLAAEMAGLTSGWRPTPDLAPAGPVRLPRVAMRTLGADVGSVRAAREFAVATLHRWGTTERSQDIAIVVSELMTNALRHGLSGSAESRPRRPIRFGLLQPGSCVLCVVADPSRTAPVVQARGFLAETGRGLHIICELSDQWGFAPSDPGKVVWAMFCPRLTGSPSYSRSTRPIHDQRRPIHDQRGLFTINAGDLRSAVHVFAPGRRRAAGAACCPGGVA